jgi:hypothetical protein
MKKDIFLLICSVLFLTSCHKKECEICSQSPFNKVYGGSFDDAANSMINSSDGGYVMVGTTLSNDGDVSGKIGDSETEDGWAIKIDGEGNKVWQKVLGGFGTDRLLGITTSSDGGYVMAGFSLSNEGDAGPNHGGSDAWVIKIDGNGNKVWQKSFGGSQYDVFESITKTNDGGYIAAGYTVSDDGDVTGLHGDYDAWVVKIDGSGNIVWQKTLGGSNHDEASAVTASGDGGYIVVGITNSNDFDVSGLHGGTDAWVIKIDGNGNIIWQKTLGGSKDDGLNSIAASSDGGYVLAGATSSNDGDVTGSHDGFDAWVVKIDRSGNIIWQKTPGGSQFDAIIRSADGKYVLAGETLSNDGGLNGFHGGNGGDGLVLKIDDSGNKIWQKTLGGTSEDAFTSIVAGPCDQYVLGGYTDSNDGNVSNNHGGRDMWALSVKNQ